MHKIYSHAQCTVVLVPELRANNLRLSDGSNYTDIRKIATSEWSKRAWTLEEALMSRRMLFIGQDVHLWSYILDRNKLGQGIGHSDIGQRFLYAICTTTTKYMASTVLWHARRRTSSKQHDRVFALANLFPETIKDLIFDYKQPLFDAMLSFYSLLAQKDPSILCFGVPFHHQYDEDHYFARKDENLLPSWSGAGGTHAVNLIANAHTASKLSAVHWRVNERLLFMTCSCIPVSIEQTTHQRRFLELYDARYHQQSIRICPGSNSLVFEPISDEQFNAPLATKAGLSGTHWFPIASEGNTVWVSSTTSDAIHSGATLSLTDSSCTECIILSGIVYTYSAGYYNVKVMPVIRHDEREYYKCIGTFFVYGNVQFLDLTIERVQTFAIR